MFSCVGIGSPFILVVVAVLSSMLQKQYMLQVQFPKFLVVFLVVFSVSKWTSTVKQGILYWTCTGPAVEVIGLVPTRD